jgi:predicted amidohydrolase YtcJ
VTDQTVILPARILHTLDPDHRGDAVAVRDGFITGVGTRADLEAANPDAVIDERYRDTVVVPGFVEAHSHLLAGAFWAHTYVGWFDRRDPDGRVWPGCRSIEDVVARLTEAHEKLTDPDAPLIAWGLDPIYFPGDRLVARHLDAVSTTRPVLVMHASIHLCTVNSVVMRAEGIDRHTAMEGVAKDAGGEPVGELQEAAMLLAGAPFLAAFGALADPAAIERFGALATRAGITTLTDLGGGPSSETDLQRWLDVAGTDEFPARVSVFTNPAFGGPSGAGLAAAMVERVARSTDKVRFGGVKLILDGSIQGFTARLTEPYLGEHPNGLWLLAPDQVSEAVRSALEPGLLLHVHCNGDEAVDVLLEACAEVLPAGGVGDHRTTVQHCQLTRPDQYERMAELGLCANLFSNHLWYWGDQHVELTVGPERAAGMNAARRVLDLGIPLSVHSDAAVTPLGPLHVAWCAVNRVTPSGRVLGPEQRITVPEAMHAITLGAAHQLRMDDEIGSITPGKRADLAVLGADPFAVDPAALREVPVLGTVLGGRHHPAA